MGFWVWGVGGSKAGSTANQNREGHHFKTTLIIIIIILLYMKGAEKFGKKFVPPMRGSCLGTLLSSASTQFVVVGWPQTVHVYSQFVVA